MRFTTNGFTAQLMSLFRRPANAGKSKGRAAYREDIAVEPMLDAGESNPPAGVEADREAELQVCAGTAQRAVAELRLVSAAITRDCRDTDPKFLRLGRDIQEIYGAAMGLTTAICDSAALLNQGGEEESLLNRAGSLVENSWNRLGDNQRIIENSLGHVHQLLAHLEIFTSVCDQITRVGLWFRVVGSNIEIECSSQQLGNGSFAGVSKEVNVLAQEIRQMVGEMKNSLDFSVNHLSNLAATSTVNLEDIRHMAERAEGIVSGAFHNIKHLLEKTASLIDTATTKARVIGEKMGEVVVGIQFHDAMSQRVEHIVEAMEDIERLCEESLTTKTGNIGETLGSAYIILDLQRQQLRNLREDIGVQALTTRSAFQYIHTEIMGLRFRATDSGLEQGGKKLCCADSVKSMRQGFQHLGELLAGSHGMVGVLRQSAEETTTVADHLLKIIQGVKAIQKEAHIKAINTIIMANQLGGRGRTIEVLAKEIRNLADQTGEMTTKVANVQENIVHEISALQTAIAAEVTTVDVADLDHVATEMEDSFVQIHEKIAGVEKEAQSLAQRINGVTAALSFLEELDGRLEDSGGRIEEILRSLEPWKEQGQIQDENIVRLLARYTMDQERLIHAPRQDGGQTTASESDCDFFFAATEDAGGGDSAELEGNIELF